MISSTLPTTETDPAQPPARSSRRWDFITCEYPPEIGGLSDYTQQLAEALSSGGSTVEIWAPGSERSERVSSSLTVHRSFNAFKISALIRIDRLWRSRKLRRNIILQWVPTGYGFHSVNLFFCLWIALQTLRGHSLSVMFHEFAYSLAERRLYLKIAGLIHRAMAALLLNCSRTSFASCLPVANQLRRYNFLHRDICILPVPSNVPACNTEIQPKSIRSHFALQDEVLIGHFGLFRPRMEAMLTPSLKKLLNENPKAKVLLVGDGSDRYHSALTLKDPELASRVFRTGYCSPTRIAEFISACDCLFQPYPEGVGTKRGSAMAVLANGKMLVCTESDETEDIWKNTPAIHLIRSRNPDCLASELASVICSPERLAAGCAAAYAFYQANFSIDKTISALKALQSRDR